MPIDCVYCARSKPATEFSLEHILPRRLGGALCNETFKIRRVCERCNNICGLFVDGAFLKCWFTTNFNAESSRSYIDLETGSVLPLVYMGELRTNPMETDDVVELWLSPTGDQLFHIHPRHDERYATYAGGDPIRSSAEPGTAILFSRTTNQAWLKTSLLSFSAHFYKARRILANVGLQSDSDRELYGRPPEEADFPWIEALRGLGDQHIPLRASVQQGFEQRFLAKVALGLGHNLLGEQYLHSDLAGLLRRAMWERDFETRASLQIPWTSFWENDDTLRQALGWPGATTIVLFPAPPFLVLSLSLFDRGPIQVAISDNPAVWSQPNPPAVGKHGSAYVIIPQRKFFSGRLDLPAFLSELHNGHGLPELRQTRDWIVPPDSLPPYEEPGA